MNGLLHATRRHFFSDCGLGVGKMALAGLLARDCFAESARAPTGPLAPKPPHFPGKAKAVIQLFMAGAPSQLELFDHKPKLAEIEGKPIPPEVIGGQRYAFIRPDAAVLGPQFRFARHGGCGAELSEVLPHLATVVDENPDPHTLEVHLDARVATTVFGASPPTAVWSYNGSIPGPLLDLNVGDRLIVHFTNHLPESTTIHWHGVRVPAAMDGTPAMQSPIEPGASFDYDFVVKDPGLVWFHPHMRSDAQVN